MAFLNNLLRYPHKYACPWVQRKFYSLPWAILPLKILLCSAIWIFQEDFYHITSGKIAHESSLFNTINYQTIFPLHFNSLHLAVVLEKSPDCCGTNPYLKELSTSFWKLKTLKYRCWVTAQMPRGFQLAAVTFGEEQRLHYPKPCNISHLLVSFPVSEQKSVFTNAVENDFYLTASRINALTK